MKSSPAPIRCDGRRQCWSITYWQSAGCSLFDHLVDAANHRQRDGEAERLGGLHVDDELHFGRLLDRQLGGLLAFENSACIDAERAVRIQNGASVSHQAASGYKLAKLEIGR